MATAALITEATVAVTAIGEICGYFGVQTGLTMCAYVGVDGAYSVMQMSIEQEATSAGDVINIMQSGTTRVGRWMSESEYDEMVATGKVQMSPNGNTCRFTNPANPNAYRAAPKSDVYVEFDVPTESIYPAGTVYWGQIYGPGSQLDRLNQYKGLPPITEMPNATNINLLEVIQ